MNEKGMVCVYCGKEVTVHRDGEYWAVSCMPCHIGAHGKTLEEAYERFKYVWGVKFPKIDAERKE